MDRLSARERTEAEFQRIVEAVGLKIRRIWKHSQGADSLVEAELVWVERGR